MSGKMVMGQRSRLKSRMDEKPTAGDRGRPSTAVCNRKEQSPTRVGTRPQLILSSASASR